MARDEAIQSDSAEERILVAAPTGADAALLNRVLAENGLRTETCGDIGDLLARAREGVGVMVLAEEALDPSHAGEFQDLLVGQEPWSEIPLLVLAGAGDVHRSRFRAQDLFGNWGNVTYLERPMRTVVLYSTLVGALRARRRQYQVRDLLGQVGELLRQRENLLASIRDGFFALDASLRFTYVNEKAAELLGMRRDEMLRRRIWDLPASALGPQFRLQFAQAASSGGPASFEEHHAESGRWCEYRTYPAPDGLSVFVADITARKRDEETLRENEERLRQYQKLEAMGKLAGGIAHDFNNILTAINGYSDLLLGREDWPEGFNRQALEEIRKAGERAAGLTRQLLAYSRKQVMTLKHLDLNEIVRDMTGILGRLLPENIRLDVKLSPGTLPIRADGTRIEQVIMNLVLNARDAMPAGGSLTVRTVRKPPSAGNVPLRKPGAGPVSAAERAAEPRLGWAALEVSDTGTGMDAETMSRIFEPFFTTKGQGKGTGLGLSTVFGVVDQLGGQVRVDSEPGRGASFEVLLRVSDARVEPAEAPAGRTHGRYVGGRETILVAEDEPSVRLFVERILASRGYSVILANDGMDALRLSRDCREEIHLLLTDVVMPRLGGRALSERILAERPGLRVLFMSGHTDDALLSHGVLDGQAHFLQKPFNTEALLAKIGEVLDRGGEGKPPAGSLRVDPPPGSLANSPNSAIP